MRHPAATGVLVSTLVLALIAPAGCGNRDTTTITLDPGQTVEDTSTLTPLERGEVRREALRDMEAAVAAWTSADRERMAGHYSEEMLARFTDQWDELAERGHTIRHDHEVILLDVTDMNATGTQVLAKYRFYDRSVVVDESGLVVEGPVDAEADAQLTAELDDDGSWIVVRIIGPVRSIR